MSEPRFALGTRVITTAKCYVIRVAEDEDKWHIPVRGNVEKPPKIITPSLRERQDGYIGKVLVSTNPGIIYAGMQHLKGDLNGAFFNKSVGWIGQTSTGVIIGYERKMIGRSVSARGEDDLGYFDPMGFVDLYIVKTGYETQPFYVPESSIYIEVPKGVKVK